LSSHILFKLSYFLFHSFSIFEGGEVGAVIWFIGNLKSIILTYILCLVTLSLSSAVKTLETEGLLEWDCGREAERTED
jgi:hypothetical protein